jgi:ElaB/YqjD/DUF883 family membrane-anchored ribosome-binding protein
LKEQAMENPMQALAAGTAVAVPAFRILRSVPPPLLMIGAGLMLASPRARDALVDKMPESLKRPDGSTVIDETVELARENWQSAKARSEVAMDEARSTVHAKAADVREAVAGIVDDAGRRAAELSGAARRNLSSAGEALSASAGAASEAAREALDTTQTSATEAFKTTRAAAENVVRDNAFLVGGVGLAIGAVIAASLPSTWAERNTLGEASDKLRDSAAEAASGTFEEVKTAAMATADDAAARVSDAGSEMSHAAEDAAEKLKTVTDETITTAFEPSQTDHR